MSWYPPQRCSVSQEGGTGGGTDSGGARAWRAGRLHRPMDPPGPWGGVGLGRQGADERGSRLGLSPRWRLDGATGRLSGAQRDQPAWRLEDPAGGMVSSQTPESTRAVRMPCGTQMSPLCHPDHTLTQEDTPDALCGHRKLSYSTESPLPSHVLPRGRGAQPACLEAGHWCCCHNKVPQTRRLK